MNAIDCIKSRRSVRVFEDKKVDKEIISELVDIATYAPSWKNSQTTRYIAVMNEAVKSDIANNGVMGSAHNKGIIDGAPCIVVIATRNLRSGYERDGSFSTSKGTHFQSFDAGIATQTFCLAAHEMGIKSVILGIIDEDAIKKILSIGDDLSISAIIAIGYNSSDVAAPKRKTAEELLTVIE